MPERQQTLEDLAALHYVQRLSPLQVHYEIGYSKDCDPKYHYYVGGHSLCGQSGRRGGPTQAGLPHRTPTGDPACARCRGMLMHNREAI